MAKSTTNAASVARKAKNHEENQARHQANLDKLKELGTPARISTVTKIRRDRNGLPARDKKGATSTYEKSYEVRPSKLIRAARRAGK